MKKKYVLILFFILFPLYASPELNQAIQKIKEILDSKQNYENILHNHHIKNHISFHEKHIHIRDLPDIFNQRWNQSRKSNNITHKNYYIIIRKYNLKHNKVEQKSYLKYKLWKYEIYENNLIYATIFWTALGEEIIFKDITLDDLLFLKDFMDQKTAKNIFGSRLNIF